MYVYAYVRIYACVQVEESLGEAVVELRGKKREMEQMKARVSRCSHAPTHSRTHAKHAHAHARAHTCTNARIIR